jgi:prepilin-type N-terminal cleavage/methylation domain-containing protein
MTNRRAFTLLELIVSITVAGIVALLAYGSANAGFDTRDALARHRATTEAALRSRVLLDDALRHASDEAGATDGALGSTFQLVDAIEANSLPADRLSFFTRGVLPPLGASGLWFMTVEPIAIGVSIVAEPVEGGASLRAVFPGARGLNVEVMPIVDRTWTTSWPATNQLPAAVRLTFYDSTRAMIGAPLVVRLGLEGVR